MTSPLAWRWRPAEFKPGEINKEERLIVYSFSVKRRTGTERLIVYSLSTRERESEEADRDGEVNRVLTQHKRGGQGRRG